MNTMDHVRYLAERIGPRGSTTPQEREAALYGAEVLRRAGLDPVIETFDSARSNYYPYALFSGLVLMSASLFWIHSPWGAIGAIAIALFALVSVLLELSFRPNPLRWMLPKGKSQNVWVRVRPQGEARDQVVLMAHLDTHRTPLIFSSPKWIEFVQIIIPLGLGSACILILLFGIGITSPGLMWRILSVPFALIIMILFLLMLQADFSPYTAGANDNATGVSVVLSMAERLAKTPLANTMTWLVLSGCEEVGCYGAEAFARAHRSELGRCIWIPLDILGGMGADPNYLISERLLLRSHSDPQLLDLARGIERRQPELSVHPSELEGAYTEGAIGAKQGFRVLTLASSQRDGALPDWHRPTDMAEKVDPEVLGRCEAFLRELTREIDRQAGNQS